MESPLQIVFRDVTPYEEPQTAVTVYRRRHGKG